MGLAKPLTRDGGPRHREWCLVVKAHRVVVHRHAEAHPKSEQPKLAPLSFGILRFDYGLTPFRRGRRGAMAA